MKWNLVILQLLFFFCVYTSSQEEIRCQQPQILHGFITGPEREYKENEQLKYICEENYRPRHGIPRCLRSGWSITPECEEITCLLGPRTLGIISPRPEGKNVFRVGESVEIACSESYWVIGTKLTKRTIRCTRSGDWEHSPVCEESSCDVPFNEHVDYPSYYFRGDRRLGVSKSYRCESGYRQEAERATCTENGWSPKPLCVDSSSLCPKPDVEIINGTIKEPEMIRNYYTRGNTVEYTCTEGFVFENETSALCTGKDWIYPKCISKILDCDQPPMIPHAVYYLKEQYEDGEKVTYDCPSYYVKEGDPHMTCRHGRWIGSVKCLEPCTVSVPVMDVRHIQLLYGGRQKIYAKHGDRIAFTCQGKRALVEDSVGLQQLCNNGVIALPVCQ